MITLRGCRIRANPVRYFSTELAQDHTAPKSSRVTIPPAIKRGPTDLLKALSDTVGVDTTAPHFAFIDDPTTIPTTAMQKQNYFLAKEMGKRAAQLLAKEWPTLVAFDRDQPRLPAFRPQHQPDPLQVEPTEANLLSMISNKQVEDSIRLYERIRSGNVKISDSAKLELFKLACYYNCKNPPFTECEEWPGLRIFGEVDASTWIESSPAELLFENIPISPETVSVLIAGLCKHPTLMGVRRAKDLLKEHGKTLQIDAFEAVISVSNFEEAKTILQQVRANKLQPRLNTWNALLKSAAKIEDSQLRSKTFKQIIGELSHLGQKPSLQSFDIIIKNLIDVVVEDPKNTKANEARDNQLKLAITWVSEIIQALESSEAIELQSAQDNLFFSNAMGIATRGVNLGLAERIVALYESPKNMVKMPAFTIESTFYNRYLMLFVEATGSIEDVHKKYLSLVPRTVGAGKQLTLQICGKLKTTPHIPLLLRVIEDGIAARLLLDYKTAAVFRERLLDVPFHSLSVSQRDAYCEVVERLVDLWIEFSNFTEERNRGMQLKMSKAFVSDVVQLLNRIGKSEIADALSTAED
ncbi:unnamed protein product [Auanema sp. JU1783]|nr:unnamed protein product [Auanema sp. JU1783]